MKRRSFIKSSLLSTSITAVLPLAGNALIGDKPNKGKTQEFYELGTYTLKTKAQENLVDEYWRNAAIPALNRMGSKHVGVFKELKPEGQTKVYVVIPFNTINDFVKADQKLLQDGEYNKAGAAYLNAPPTEPAYERIESSLLHAFAHMPVIEVPLFKQRIFELRRYESASESAGKKKIEMFNQAGEIDIFKRVGLGPVFFGESIIGNMRPNLTYMLSFEDMADHDKKWKLFGSDPEWKKISSIPEYADAKIVSRITSTFLVPASYSQI